MSDLSDRLRQYADIAEAGGKQHWAEAMREAMYTLAVYRDNSVKEQRENAALRAELERVRKDAERWRYRINYEYEISCSSTAISREEWIASRTAAIDAAIAQGKGEK